MENIHPDTLVGPPHEAIVECLARAIGLGSINPSPAGFQNMHNAADDTSVVNTRLAARIGRQKRLKPGKLLIRQPEMFANHDRSPCWKP
jgi:hypothetical protein